MRVKVQTSCSLIHGEGLAIRTAEALIALKEV